MPWFGSLTGALALALPLCAALPAQAEETEETEERPPLLRLAGEVPLSALELEPPELLGTVYLVDIAAARQETANFRTNPGAPWWVFRLGRSLRTSMFDLVLALLSVGQKPEDFARLHGFAMTEISQIASGWGSPEDSAAVIFGGAGLTDDAAFAAALEPRGYQRRMVDGVPVWFRWEDGDYAGGARDPETLRKYKNEDIYTGPIIGPVRLALDAPWLKLGRTWSAIDALISDGPSLLDDPEALAILEAVYAAEMPGQPIQIVLSGSQPDRRVIAIMTAKIEVSPRINDAEAEAWIAENLETQPWYQLPTLPPFGRMGLAEWQDGRRMAAAILLTYGTEAEAETALARFEVLLDAAPSLAFRTSMAEALPFERDFRIVEAGGRFVVLLAFSHEIGGEGSDLASSYSKTAFWRLDAVLLGRSTDLSLILSR